MMMRFLFLAVALNQMVTTAGDSAQPSISYFSFYDFWLQPAMAKPPYNFSFPQAAKFINLPTMDLGVAQVRPDFQYLPQWHALGGSLEVMWDVEKSGVFHPPCFYVDCTKVAQSGLSANWQQTLDTAIAQVKALEAGTFSPGLPKVKTIAWFLGDELIENGTQHTGAGPHLSEGTVSIILSRRYPSCEPDGRSAAHQTVVGQADQGLPEPRSCELCDAQCSRSGAAVQP